MSWEDFESTQRWMQRLSARRKGAKSTKDLFLYYLSEFCKFTKKNPDELITQRRENQKSDDEVVQRRIEEQVEAFSIYVRKNLGRVKGEDAAPNTVSTAVAAVRSFFRYNYKPLVEVAVPSPYPVRQNKIPQPEELRALVESCKDKLLKAWILCQGTSGISNIDLLKLEFRSKWCHSVDFGFIGEQLKKGIEPLHIHIVREKTAASGLGWYDTFIGTHGCEALNEFVDFSRSRLFNVSNRSIETKIRDLGIAAEIATPEAPIRPYSLRKYFETRLQFAKVTETFIDYMMGHSLGKVKGAYAVPAPVELRQFYVEHYRFLNPFQKTPKTLGSGLIKGKIINRC